MRGDAKLLLPPSTPIFSGSVAENIRLGDPMASDDELQEAAQLARAHELLWALPQGYETKIGEAGFS